MRRRLSLVSAVLAVIAGLVLAGCGSSSSSSNPLQTSLSYFPKDSLFVMSLQTDPNSSAIQSLQALLHRFPAVTFGESALIARLQQVGINYDADIKPLLGNPAVVGVASPSPALAKSSFLVSWVTKSSDTLNGLVKKLHLSSSQTIDGAKVYAVSTAALAIDGSTLVLGASPSAVKSALDLHSHGGGLTPDDQSKAMGNLPTDSLISAFGDLTAVLSQPSTAQAKKVPWVNALKGYGVAISANATGLTTQYRLDTSGTTLSESQLPIAPGSSPPSLAGSLPISVGVTDPSRIVTFVEQAEQLASPSSYAKFTARQAAVRAKTGVDLTSLLKLLTGEAQLSSDGHATMIRGQLSDPAAAKTTLGKLATDPKAFSAGPVTDPPRAGRLLCVQGGRAHDHRRDRRRPPADRRQRLPAAADRVRHRSVGPGDRRAGVGRVQGEPAGAAGARTQAGAEPDRPDRASLARRSHRLARRRTRGADRQLHDRDQVSRRRSSSAPRFDSGSLRFPHFGDCTHDGQPSLHGHSPISRWASPTSRSNWS